MAADKNLWPGSAAVLVLKLLEEQDGFDWTEGGYVAAISQGAFFSFAVDGKTTGSLVLP